MFLTGRLFGGAPSYGPWFNRNYNLLLLRRETEAQPQAPAYTNSVIKVPARVNISPKCIVVLNYLHIIKLQMLDRTIVVTMLVHLPSVACHGRCFLVKHTSDRSVALPLRPLAAIGVAAAVAACGRRCFGRHRTVRRCEDAKVLEVVGPSLALLSSVLHLKTRWRTKWGCWFL